MTHKTTAQPRAEPVPYPDTGANGEPVYRPPPHPNAEPWIDKQVETFVSQYNDAYCDQRKAGVDGGDSERAAMRQVLILALGAYYPPAQPSAEPNAAKVICPQCCHQFRAIPIQTQRLMLAAGFEPPFNAPTPHPNAEPERLND